MVCCSMEMWRSCKGEKMKKLEAATRDRAAAAWRERKVMYKVGNVEVV